MKILFWLVSVILISLPSAGQVIQSYNCEDAMMYFMGETLGTSEQVSIQVDTANKRFHFLGIFEINGDRQTLDVSSDISYELETDNVVVYSGQTENSFAASLQFMTRTKLTIDAIYIYADCKLK